MVFLLAQQRGITRHNHHVGILLNVAKVHGLNQCRLHGSRSRCPFTKIHLRSLRVVAVIIVLIVQEPSRRLIVVLVHHVNIPTVLLGEAPSLDIVCRRVMEGSNGSAYYDVGVFLLYGLAYHEAPLLEYR